MIGHDLILSQPCFGGDLFRHSEILENSRKKMGTITHSRFKPLKKWPAPWFLKNPVKVETYSSRRFFAHHNFRCFFKHCFWTNWMSLRSLRLKPKSRPKNHWIWSYWWFGDLYTRTLSEKNGVKSTPSFFGFWRVQWLILTKWAGPLRSFFPMDLWGPQKNCPKTHICNCGYNYRP